MWGKRSGKQIALKWFNYASGWHTRLQQTSTLIHQAKTGWLAGWLPTTKAKQRTTNDDDDEYMRAPQALFGDNDCATTAVTAVRLKMCFLDRCTQCWWLSVCAWVSASWWVTGRQGPRKPFMRRKKVMMCWNELRQLRQLQWELWKFTHVTNLWNDYRDSHTPHQRLFAAYCSRLPMLAGSIY